MHKTGRSSALACIVQWPACNAEMIHVHCNTLIRPWTVKILLWPWLDQSGSPSPDLTLPKHACYTQIPHHMRCNSHLYHFINASLIVLFLTCIIPNTCTLQKWPYYWFSHYTISVGLLRQSRSELLKFSNSIRFNTISFDCFFPL